MLNIFTNQKVRSRMESGPMGPYLSAIAAELLQQGYARSTIRRHLRAADHFGTWLVKQGLSLKDISEPIVDRYLKGLNRQFSPSCPGGRLLHQALGIPELVRFLRRQGVLQANVERQQQLRPTEGWLMDFDHHLDQVAGNAQRTRQNYLRYARRFLIEVFGTEEPNWSGLQPEQITEFVRREASKLQPSSCGQPVTAIRALLRFLVSRGVVPQGLERAVPPVLTWRHSSLPRYITSSEVEGVIGVCNPATPLGLRERAVIVLLAHLGLRAGEVIRLKLDDIDWFEGRLIVRAGKNHRERSLPLSQEVGDVLVSYLRDARLASPHREVFLRWRPPFRPLRSSVTITALVAKALKRAGVKVHRPGAHILRHTLATQMVRQGAAFKEIADILGHLSLASTSVYAKLDLESLSKVAMPWPVGCTVSSQDLFLRVERYVSLRRALGYVVTSEEKLLKNFVRFVEAQMVTGPIRAQMALDWACAASPRRGLAGQTSRLKVVRGFLSHLQAAMPETEVPGSGMLAKVRRPKPYLYSRQQIEALIRTASLLRPKDSLRPHTFATLIGLIASTGLRVSEAIHLTVRDVHLDADPPHLEVLQTKFRKSRLVPLHTTTADQLRLYAQERKRLHYDGLSDAFFVSEQGSHLRYGAVWQTFVGLARRTGIRHDKDTGRPCIHGLRHSFAVGRLLDWYRRGLLVNDLLPTLSVYMGHVEPANTYWYLTATPELLNAAGEYFQNFAAQGVQQ